MSGKKSGIASRVAMWEKITKDSHDNSPSGPKPRRRARTVPKKLKLAGKWENAQSQDTNAKSEVGSTSPVKKRRNSRKMGGMGAMWEAKIQQQKEEDEQQPHRNGVKKTSSNASSNSSGASHHSTRDKSEKDETLDTKDEENAVQSSDKNEPDNDLCDTDVVLSAKTSKSSLKYDDEEKRSRVTSPVGSSSNESQGSQGSQGKKNKLEINLNALKPGAKPPKKTGKVGALAAGLQLNIGALRPGAKPPTKKIESKQDEGELSALRFEKPTITAERGARTNTPLSMNALEGALEELQEFICQHFKYDEGLIIPEKNMVLVLLEFGFNLKRARSPRKLMANVANIDFEHEMEHFDISEWHVPILDRVLTTLFGESVRHKWGYHLRAVEANV